MHVFKSVQRAEQSLRTDLIRQTFGLKLTEEIVPHNLIIVDPQIRADLGGRTFLTKKKKRLALDPLSEICLALRTVFPRASVGRH